jgi:hypothetical protein
MKLGIKLGASVIAVASLLAASSASATIIQWTLEDAVFDDGGKASGSFEYDTVSGAYFDINFTTTTGTSLTGNTYTAEDPASVVRNYGFGSILAPGATATGDPLFDVNTTSDFTTPTTVTIGAPGQFLSSEGTCANTGCLTYNPIRSLSGSIVGVAVPEPATWAMMLLGLGGLGAAMRSRRNSFSIA